MTDVRAKHVHCAYDNKIVRVINFPRFLGMYLPLVCMHGSNLLTTHPLHMRGLLTAWYSDMPSVFLIRWSRLAMAFVGLYLGGPDSGFAILGGKIMSEI